MAEDFRGQSAGLAPGDQVAGYQIEEQIGRGGMAVVYRALDLRLGRPVALKVLAPHLSTDDAFRQRFIRESRAAAGVDHPHIIPVFEAGQSGEVLFIAMRYVAFGDVRGLVEAEGRLTASRTVSITAQVASALDAAHAHGLVHRDVKPGNILVDRSAATGTDHAYLSDFGLSKHSLAATTLTAAGQFMGTLDYVSPEQIQGHPADGRADQYALACTVMEMLTGAPPFRRDQSMALLWDQLEARPPPVTQRRPDLPPAIDAVVGVALAKAPADRYPTCVDFITALRAAFDGGPVAPVPVQARPAAGAQPSPPVAAVARPTPLAAVAPPGARNDQRPGLVTPVPGVTRYDRNVQQAAGPAAGRTRSGLGQAPGARGPSRPPWERALSAPRWTAPLYRPARTGPRREDHLVPQPPSAPPRRRRYRAAAAIAAMAAVAGLGTAGYLLQHQRPQRGPAAATTTTPDTTGSQVPASPTSVVQAYITAINAQDYQTAWDLVGRKGPSFQAFAAGFVGTAQDTLVIEYVTGNVVTAKLTAAQTDGTVKYYQGTYTVTGGIISSSHVERVSG